MTDTWGIGRIFVHWVKLPAKSGVKRYHTRTTRVTPPYREGSTWVVRVLPKRGIGIGRWDTDLSEFEALRRAIGFKVLSATTHDIRRWDEDSAQDLGVEDSTTDQGASHG